MTLTDFREEPKKEGPTGKCRAFNVSLSLGKLMLYQLSYSRTMSYGCWGLQVSNRVSIRYAVNSVSIARAMPVLEASSNSPRSISGRQPLFTEKRELGFRVLGKED